MSKLSRHSHPYKYSELIIKTEAYLFLQGYTLNQVSETLNIPNSTVSWHLIHPLFSIDFDMWLKVREILRPRAHDRERVKEELYWENFAQNGGKPQ